MIKSLTELQKILVLAKILIAKAKNLSLHVKMKNDLFAVISKTGLNVEIYCKNLKPFEEKYIIQGEKLNPNVKIKIYLRAI